jgi:hypothetical protein
MQRVCSSNQRVQCRLHSHSPMISRSRARHIHAGQGLTRLSIHFEPHRECRGHVGLRHASRAKCMTSAAAANRIPSFPGPRSRATLHPPQRCGNSGDRSGDVHGAHTLFVPDFSVGVVELFTVPKGPRCYRSSRWRSASSEPRAAGHPGRSFRFRRVARPSCSDRPRGRRKPASPGSRETPTEVLKCSHSA